MEARDIKFDDSKGLKQEYVIDKINELQARCDRFRDILIEIGFVKLENIEEFLAAGKLTANDVRYLYGLDAIEELTPEEVVECGKAVAEGFAAGIELTERKVSVDENLYDVVKEVRDENQKN